MEVRARMVDNVTAIHRQIERLLHMLLSETGHFDPGDTALGLSLHYSGEVIRPDHSVYELDVTWCPLDGEAHWAK